VRTATLKTTTPKSTTRTAGSAVARTGIAIGIASLAGYALLAIVGRSLSPAEFGLFVAFWGVLFGLGSSLSTIEQEVARQAARTTDEESGPPAPAVTTAAAVLGTLVASVTLVPAVAERLFGQADSWIGLVVTLAALGFAVQFAVRGLLVGSGDVRAYSWLVIAEAAARLVVLVAILLLFGLELRTAAVAVGVGSYAWLLWAGRARKVLPHRGLPRATWRAATGRAASLMLGAALIAAVITGFPTLVTALTDGSPGAAGGAVFAALTVSRVPLLLISPVQALAVPFVVRARENAATDGVANLRKGLLLGTAAFAALGLVAGTVGWAIGPWVVRLVYGPQYDVPRAAIALLLLSACLLAWSQLLSAALIALAAHRRMLLMWGAAVTATVVWLVVSPLDVVATTAVGALAGPLAALAIGIPAVAALVRPATPDPAARRVADAERHAARDGTVARRDDSQP
jgi:O-antigen/teichoic acid export membrane protein